MPDAPVFMLQSPTLMLARATLMLSRVTFLLTTLTLMLTARCFMLVRQLFMFTTLSFMSGRLSFMLADLSFMLGTLSLMLMTQHKQLTSLSLISGLQHRRCGRALHQLRRRLKPGARRVFAVAGRDRGLRPMGTGAAWKRRARTRCRGDFSRPSSGFVGAGAWGAHVGD